jgi:spermidine synthase
MRQENAIRTGLFALGFLAMGMQVYLIRACMSLFTGTELVAGIVLSSWMLLTGLGAWLARFSGRLAGLRGLTLVLMLFLSLLPWLTIILLNLLKAWLVPYGSMAELNIIAGLSFLVAIPFGLVNGYLFTSLNVLLSRTREGSSVSAAYVIESAGSLVAGALVNFILLWTLGLFQGLAVLTLIYLAGTIVFALSFSGKRILLVSIAWSVGLAAVILFTDPAVFSAHLQYRDQRVICSRSTPYGELAVTEQAGQLNFYGNGLLLFSGGNEMASEEQVHFALSQHPGPRKVLLVSGGFSGTIQEIMKYRPARVDVVEPDPAMIRVGQELTPVRSNGVVELTRQDARRFVRNTALKFDAALINVPAPSTLQLNRYYTLGFFRELKRTLEPGAVVSVSLPTGSDYVSEPAGLLNASLFRTLRAVFGNVIIIPAGKNYFLASDSALSVDVPALVAARGIKTNYVNQWYFDASLMKQRSDYILANMPSMEPANRDLHPRAYFLQVRYWLSHFGDHWWFVAGTGLLLLLVVMATLRPVSAGLFTGGFTAASLEVLVIFGLQVAFGYVYSLIGMVMMLFMGGLAIGSGVCRRIFPRQAFRPYLAVQLALGAAAVLTTALITLLVPSGIPGYLLQVVMALLVLAVSILVGMEYSLAARLSSPDPAVCVSRNYSADLAGSAAGAFLVTVICFPLLGLAATGAILALLNLASALLLFLRRKKIVSL